MKKIAILTACMGLGTYVPALTLKEELIKQNQNVEIVLYEDFIDENRKNNLKYYQKAFHKDIKLAIAGHQLMGKLSKKMDVTSIANKAYDILKIYDELVVFSGNWVDVILFLEEKYAFNVSSTFVHLDCEKAPSWQNKNIYPKGLKDEIWLLGSKSNDAQYMLYKGTTVKFDEREDRFLLYGGGWGMGNYLNYSEELSKHHTIDIIIHDKTDKVGGENRCLYMFPDDWNPWDKDENGDFYIPDLIVCDFINDEICLTPKKEQHNFNRSNKGIISKPGGGTILDALAYCTPLIFLEPISRHEQENATYYLERGLAITIEEWRNTNYSLAVLEKISDRMKKYTTDLKMLTDLFR